MFDGVGVLLITSHVYYIISIAKSVLSVSGLPVIVVSSIDGGIILLGIVGGIYVEKDCQIINIH